MQKYSTIFVICIVQLLCITAFQKAEAVTANPNPVQYKQPDGSVITLQMKGDEFIHWATTIDGYMVMSAKTGFYEYAMKLPDGQVAFSGIQVHDPGQRTSTEIGFVASLQPGLFFSSTQIQEIKQYLSGNHSPNLPSVGGFPTTGVRAHLLILANFNNTSTTYTQTNFANLLNQVNYNSTGSFRDYYLEVSYGQLTVNTDVTVWVTLPHPHDYYGPQAMWGTFAYDAVVAADQQAGVNYALYDNDLDGVVDGVCIAHQGRGQEESGNTNDIWSHSWDLSSAGYTAAQRTFDGVQVLDYTTIPEKGSSSTMTTVGVMCHEFGHNLGAPDFYDTDYATNGQYDGTGDWDIMAQGSWNGSPAGSRPAHHNPWTKIFYNWLTPTVLATQQPVLVRNILNYTDVFRYNTTTTNEYFLCENRQQTGFNTSIPGHGMIIYHVDGNYISAHMNAGNINCTSHQGLYPMSATSTTANGIMLSSGSTINTGGCPWPGTSNKTTFTDATTPNSKSWAGANTAKSLISIAENTTTHEITFCFIACSSLNDPSNFTATAVSSSQINLGWTKDGNNDPVMVAYSLTGTFGTPATGTTYSAGNTIPGGGTVLYNGTNTTYNQTGLTPNTTYYYKAWSVMTGTNYSPGITANATTFCVPVTTLPFSEGFATTTIPGCWSQVDNQGNGLIWQFGTITGESPIPALTGNYAYLNSDAYGGGNSQNADLITPTLNLSAYSAVTLQFNHYFKAYSGSSGKLSYSINNGTSWTLITTFTTTSTTNPAAFSQAISAVAGQSQVKFKWNYTGTWGWYWAFDDVQITGTCTTTLPVSVSIGASANPVCTGTSVTFTATQTNGGTTPAYQWKVNGINVGTNSTTYSYTPVNNDAVTCGLTSSASCVTGNPATSNTVTMTVNPNLPVSVSIAPSANPVCAGTSVTFTPTPTNGGTPTYQWFKNAVFVSSGSTYSYVPVNGDKVYVIMTSSLTCKTGSPATSNTVTIMVDPVLPVSVSIAPSANPVCPGTSVTFTPTPVNGGTPTYQWFKNTVFVSSGSTYSYVPVNGDKVYVIMTSSLTCKTGSPANSNMVTMMVDPVLPVSVSITPSDNPVCAGTSVTFTPTPTNGGTPTYEWFKNTVSVGSGSTYSYVPLNGDQVYVIMTSSLTCKTGSPATSNTVTMMVDPVLPVSVSIAPSANPVCAGTSVTFTAIPTNGGPTPFYQWKVNGIIVGTNSSTYSYAPVNNDVVTCVLTSNATCPTDNPSTSNTVTMTVNVLPAPTISGSGSICAGTTGVNYSTETGMTGYTWNVSAGGTITSGNETNIVSITWSTAGVQTVSVNYTNSNGCTATSPTIKNVTVNPVNVPTITGTGTLCLSTQTYVYTTETGMNNYIWHVSTGGTITGGGTTTSRTVTIRWNTTGAQWVSVNYSNSYSCSAANATIYPVIVNPIPVPTLTGSNKVCAGTTGVIYTTQPGMTNYIWTVSLGGTITGGGTSTSNTVTVTWNTAGSKTVTVNYTNSSGCMAASPVSYPVTVYALPAPTLTGPVSVCAGKAGNVYTTQAGMSNYIWYVSPGGTITTGGSSTNNTVTVTWNTVGTQIVSVNYTNSSGCTAAAPVVLGVTVNPLPAPTITGSSILCSGVPGIYTTQPGNANYTWTVSSGATIVAGGTTTSSSITVKWTVAGLQWIRVNYTNSSGCKATTYTQFNVTVNPPPVPSITGLKTVCQGSTGIVYTTQTGMTGYLWTISTGGIITAGAGTNYITVSWTGYGSQWVKVNYSNTFGCTAATPVQYNVTVNRATVPSISGTNTVCAGTPGIVYTTQSGMTNYIWTVSAGGTIISGSGTRLVYVLWNTPGANTISVIYTPSSGCPVLTPTVKAVTVYAIPIPTITGPTSPCVGASEFYITEAGMTNYTWTLGGSGGTIYSGSNSYKIYIQWVSAGAKTVSVNYTATGGCRAPTPTVLNINVVNCTDSMITGSDPGLSPASFTVYPNPNNGTFNAVIQCECQEECSIDVYNMMGVKVFELTYPNKESKMVVPIDLQDLPQGIYTVIFRTSNHWMFRKIVINK